jgi:hypothetical protein
MKRKNGDEKKTNPFVASKNPAARAAQQHAAGAVGSHFYSII